MTIPFNRPSVEGRELEYVAAAVGNGHTSAAGPFTTQVCELLRAAHGAPDALLTSSCTDALEMTALLLDLGPRDAVVVPSFTFVSTALAYARTGAKLLFCDVEPDTLALDPHRVRELLETHPDVRAVVHVHYAGIAGDLDALRAVLAEHPRVTLIEDNAHGLFGAHRDRALGTFGALSTLSFHETKNFICGEGGALIVNDERLVDRAHVLLDKGTDRRAFLHGSVDKYTWRDIGSSFGLSDILAAYLLGQLERRERILERRRSVFERYITALACQESAGALRLPVVPTWATPAYHMFYVLLPSRELRDHALEVLREDGVQGTFHYVPLHRSTGGMRFAHPASGACPVTDDVAGRLLRLPFYNGLGAAEQDHVIASLVRATSRVGAG